MVVSIARRRGWFRARLFVLAAGLLLAPSLAAAKPFEWDLPPGYFPPDVPEDNPMTWEKVELGRFLFYDTRMSGNETFSCASCHHQELAFTDGLGRAIGSLGDMHLRGSMSLANVAYNATLTWGNPNTFFFEDQALTPMFGENPIIELGLVNRDQLLDRLRPDPRYRRLFAEAYPDEADPFTLDAVVKALASFERTLLSFNSPVDRYILGIDDNALSRSALRGMDLFYTDTRPSGGLLQCHHCHGQPVTFSSSYYYEGTFQDRRDATKFLNNGLYALEDGPCSAPNPNTGRVEPGNYPIGNRGTYDFANPSDRNACLQMGAFKAPTLRNIAVTGPYMHDGSIATLDEVIDHYAEGGRAKNNPFKDGLVGGFQISASERQDLLAFLNALTDEEFLTNPKFADPFQPPLCTGDCDYDGVVSIDELVTNVGIEMEEETLASCLNGDADGDGTVDLGEMIQAVNGALKGCPEPVE